MYFMIGLPTETMDDVCGIADLAQKVLEVYFTNPERGKSKADKYNRKYVEFCAKAFTAFQWAKQGYA